MMKNIHSMTARKKILLSVLAVSVLILFRIWLSFQVGIQAGVRQVYDDQLMFRYADLADHFSNPDILSLVKTMSYPLFLAFTGWTGIPYPAATGILWSLAALYFGWMVWKIGQREGLSWLAFLYILFFPSAFELWLGTRLYRNSLIVPCTILLFTYFVLFTWENLKSCLSRFSWLQAFLAGLFFTFCTYIKEDGAWLIVCLAFFVLVNLIISLSAAFRHRNKKSLKKQILALLCLFLVSGTFLGSAQAYRQINKKYFGVAEVETRNKGSLGQFAAYVYQTESENRTPLVWAPADAVKKVYESSEMLMQYPQLLEAIEHSSWYGNDIYANPIRGDFLTWVLRTALQETGLWTTEKEMDDLFRQANAEIEAAFEDGRLTEDSRIQISASGGGRTVSEMLELFPLMVQGYKGAIWLDGYENGTGRKMKYVEPAEIAQLAEQLTHVDYLSDYSKKPEHSKVHVLIDGLFWFYRFFNTFLLAVFAAGLCMALKTLFSKKVAWTVNTGTQKQKALFLLLSALVIAGISMVYAFAISWFMEFVVVDDPSKVIMNFYFAGLPALLTFPAFLMLIQCSDTLKETERSLKAETESQTE